jgi:predicted DNA-binding protein YlxM (UPF0122 family)
MVDKMYKVKEVAQQCGVSTAAIYKEIKRVDNELTTVVNGVTYINDDGLRYFLDRFKPKATGINEELVISLLRQLEEKDRQISQLMEQARNYQILLKAEQDKTLLLSAPKKPLLQRWFGRNKPLSAEIEE